MTFTTILFNPCDLANRRHIGPSPEKMTRMLQTVGVLSQDALIYETVPLTCACSLDEDEHAEVFE